LGYPSLFQAEILREWNELDAALQLVEEGLSLCGQIEMMATLMFVFFGYAVLLRVQLSHGALDAACSTLQQIERIGITMNQPLFLYIYSFYTTVDQVRLWLARGELERATRWAEELDLRERHGTPFACEREEVACTRVLLANKQPDLALQRLEPVLQRATQGQRWSHVIEVRLLQALAHQMSHEVPQALDCLSEAVKGRARGLHPQFCR
jgi:LuxR family maltose regulon positive regulatory protein